MSYVNKSEGCALGIAGLGGGWYFFLSFFRSALLNKHKKIHFSFFYRKDKTLGKEFN